MAQVSNTQETRSKLIQIFRYLQALNQLRNPVPYTVEEQPWLTWFHDIPEHPCIRYGTFVNTASENEEAPEADGFILKVRRPAISEPPAPPQGLADWLQPGWQLPDGKVQVHSSLTRRTANSIQTFNFHDEPRLNQLLDTWKIHRNTWAETESINYRAYTLFDKLYALHSQLERESERLEFMLGNGILDWTPDNAPRLHHPLLLVRIQLQFNPDIPEFTLVETGQPPELYTALFQTVPGLNASDIARSREDFESNGWHPLGGEDTKSFFKRLVNRISARAEFLEEGETPRQKNVPTIAYDPVLFLRPRVLGLNTALEAILESLPTNQNLPYALTSLTGIEGQTNTATATPLPTYSLTSPNGEDEAILLSKPANAEQLEIAKKLEKQGAVLVQGPPGTGKTHTIANLIGHLLAQGKSVLVTSERPKALRVLRDKVVEPLQPLCVSILEDDSRKEMERTIDAISERLASSNVETLEREAEVLTKQRLEILSQLRKTRTDLLEAQSGEYRAIAIGDTTYSPADAARYLTNQQAKSDWIPRPIEAGAVLPLTKDELAELYTTNATISSREEREMTLFLPDITTLLSPTDFERLVTEQIQLLRENLDYRRDLWSTQREAGSPQEIQLLQQRLIQEVEPLRDLTQWRLAVIAAGKEGGLRRQAWEELIQAIEATYKLAIHAELSILNHDPAIPEHCLPGRIEKVLDEVLEYMTKGGKINGFKLFTKREWKTLIEEVRVKGCPPETLEHFEAIRAVLRLQQARQDLSRRWQRQMTALGGPDVQGLGPEPEKIFHQYVQTLQTCLSWYGQIWAPLENALKQQGFHWDTFLAEMPVQHNEHGDILRLRAAVVEKLPDVIHAEVFRRISAQHEARITEQLRVVEKTGSSATTPEVVSRLREAIRTKNPSAYRDAYEQLNDLTAKRSTLRRRQELLNRLTKIAPGWATAIRERIGVHGGRDLPGNVEDAWLYRQLSEELDKRSKVSLTGLQEKIVQLSNELFRTTAELVEKKAWAQQIRHTSLEQRRALQGWRELMKKVGKGTGKRAPRLQEAARQLMPLCQTAVPVWIMPLSYVTRSFDMRRNRFDVVIIDEASQADITALTAVYMGSQVVVVGDHEQVSPMAVGQRLDEVQHLIDEHLQGIPLAEMYDGKLSIYGLARTTFEPVCLLEHFRCVSPIIEFSNNLSYHGKIKPLRDDSEVQRRPAMIALPVKSSGRNSKINKEEARTITSLLLAATEQPEYRDATFGVISLLGAEQALYIETLLRQHMPVTEYIQRQVLCGDPAQFQGDERDVIFLSMVDTPTENGGPLMLRTGEGHDEMFKKRFNVAASRARDQMWVVHSLDPEIDLKPEDIRRRLILHARDYQSQQKAVEAQEQKVESEFERQVFDRLVRAGYKVITQWPVGAYRIDMVVEGNKKRLAIECDGDRYHPQEKLEADMARQAILERLGWRFARIRGSEFFRDPESAMQPVFARLQSLGITQDGMTTHHALDKSGSELKERILRRAQEIQQQLTNDISLPGPKTSSNRYTTRANR